MSLSDARQLLSDAQLAVEQSEQQLRSGNFVQALRLLDLSRRLRERSAEAFDEAKNQAMHEL